MVLTPLRFQPIYKPKLWGGDRIIRHFLRNEPTAEPIGESWELADLEEDQSRVCEGPWQGQSLGELRDRLGTDLLGSAGLFEGRFPLLLKFLDANAWLSVQVHPSEQVARRLGGSVRIKHEAWYVLATEPGGAILHGLEPGVDARNFREAMSAGRIEGVLRRIAVRPGECYYLPSGTPHALGAGVMVAEIQTPSDITYRTYDWGRVEPATGQPRALHLDEAMACIDFDAPPPAPLQVLEQDLEGSFAVEALVRCSSFVVQRFAVDRPVHEPCDTAGQMAVWMVLNGKLNLVQAGTHYPAQPGDVVLLPAEMGPFMLETTGPVSWLRVTVPPQV